MIGNCSSLAILLSGGDRELPKDQWVLLQKVCGCPISLRYPCRGRPSQFSALGIEQNRTFVAVEIADAKRVYVDPWSWTHTMFAL